MEVLLAMARVTWGIQDAGNDAAASINQNGILLAVKPGTVTVTAQPQNGLGIIKQDITISSKNIVSFAYKGTAMASNQADSARSPVQAIDEDLISMWRAANNSDSQWFQLQMKQFVPVTGVKIRWYEGNQPQAFVLKTSTDGSDWKTVYAQGYVTFSIAHCSSYVVLPKNAANPYPVKSDTTYPVGVKNGKTYTFGITVSGNAIPSLAVGNSKVFESTMKREGNKYYVKVKAVGTSGAMTALYSTFPGQKSTVLCYLAVAK